MLGRAIGAGQLVVGGIIFGDGVRRKVASTRRGTATAGSLEIRL